MPKMRVHELAKLLDKSSKEIIAELKQQGVEVQSHMSTVSDEHVDKLKAKFQKKESGNNRGNNESRSNDNRGSRNEMCIRDRGMADCFPCIITSSSTWK